MNRYSLNFQFQAAFGLLLIGANGAAAPSKINILNEKIRFYAPNKFYISETNKRKFSKYDSIANFFKFRNFCRWGPLLLLAPELETPSYVRLLQRYSA
jgi:hypothetical protein